MARLPLTRNPFNFVQADAAVGAIPRSSFPPDGGIALVGRGPGAENEFFFDLFDDIGAPEFARRDHAVAADYLQDLVAMHERVCGRHSETSLARRTLPFPGWKLWITHDLLSGSLAGLRAVDDD